MRRKKIIASDITVDDDGLYAPEIGDWAERKYRLLWHYANLFATSMKKKWDQRVFIDLFSGSGYARIRGTNRIVQTSSLLALQVTDPFDFYVFCDSDTNCIDSLKQRVARLNSKPACYFENCNVNIACAEIIARLPLHGQNRTVLSFCFVDPFRLSDIKFETIRSFATRFVDFLVHIPAMDPIRNESVYYSDTSTVVSDYLGDDLWRNERNFGDRTASFDFYLAKKFDSQMKSLGYVYGGISETVMIRSTEKNLPLYRLGFYSRSRLGEEFWKEAKKYSDPQLSLF